MEKNRIRVIKFATPEYNQSLIIQWNVNMYLWGDNIFGIFPLGNQL